jgi:hypothetical protein
LVPDDVLNQCFKAEAVRELGENSRANGSIVGADADNGKCQPAEAAMYIGSAGTTRTCQWSRRRQPIPEDKKRSFTQPREPVGASLLAMDSNAPR